MMNECESRPRPERTLPAMVEPVPQIGHGKLYQDELDALYHGTLFKELYKPMHGYDKLPVPREADMGYFEELYYYDWMEWFDTHMDDVDAQAMLLTMKQRANQQGSSSRAAEMVRIAEQRMENHRSGYQG